MQIELCGFELMVWLIEQVIAFLQDLKDAPLLAQLLTVAGIPGVLIGTPVFLMTRKVRASVTRYEALQQSLGTAQREAKRLEDERDALKARSAEAFVRQHAREMGHGNDERAMDLAETFLEDQRDALALAFRTRMDEAIRQSVSDGAPAFATAQLWARAAQAMTPRDVDLLRLVRELRAAEAAAAEGAQVKLKDDAAREQQIARETRLPMDLEALASAWEKTRAEGRYGLMLALAQHGEMIARRTPFGEGSQEHLLMRRRSVEALRNLGNVKDALEKAERLVAGFKVVFGERDSEMLYARSELAECKRDIGDAAGALADLESVLPIRTEIYDATHVNVLTTRFTIAACKREMGDVEGALADLEELLPLETKVNGARHPHVLTTWFTFAACKKEMGDVEGALAELEELLPIETEVKGATHPHVWVTRRERAACWLDLGRVDDAAEEAGAVREGLEAAGILPEHRNMRLLAELEDRIAIARGAVD